MKRIFINVGFITNSSSVVHWFPREVLESPDVKAFLEAYELSGGYVGDNLWSRDTCGSFLNSDEQFKRVQAELHGDEYGKGPDIGSPEKHVVVIYGDEYSNITSDLCELLREACEKMGLNGHQSTEYN